LLGGAKPIEEEEEDEAAGAHAPPQTFWSGHSPEIEECEEDEMEDSFDNRMPTEESFHRMRITSLAEIGLDPLAPSAGAVTQGATFEVPSHTAPHLYQVPAGPHSRQIGGSSERLSKAKHFPSYLLQPQPASTFAAAPAHFPSTAITFSPSAMTFAPSLSLVASFASHNFGPGRPSHSGSKSTFSVQDLCDLDWSGNGAARDDELFFVKECADMTDFEVAT